MPENTTAVVTGAGRGIQSACGHQAFRRRGERSAQI